MMMEIAVAAYATVAIWMALRLLLAPDTTPVHLAWRPLLLCVAVAIAVAALWPVVFTVEAVLERVDPEAE